MQRISNVLDEMRKEDLFVGAGMTMDVLFAPQDEYLYSSVAIRLIVAPKGDKSPFDISSDDVEALISKLISYNLYLQGNFGETVNFIGDLREGEFSERADNGSSTSDNSEIK
jgi:hypothetical protein